MPCLIRREIIHALIYFNLQFNVNFCFGAAKFVRILKNFLSFRRLARKNNPFYFLSLPPSLHCMHTSSSISHWNMSAFEGLKTGEIWGEWGLRTSFSFHNISEVEDYISRFWNAPCIFAWIWSFIFIAKQHIETKETKTFWLFSPFSFILWRRSFNEGV